MKNAKLSRKAMDMLHDNGYSFRNKEGIVMIKRSSDNMAVIVLMIVLLFASIPLFAAGIIYGVLLIAGALGVVFIRRKFFSKKSSLAINLKNETFTLIVGTTYLENQPLKMISKLSVDSKFLGSYTSASRSNQEEHLISIRIELITKEDFVLFRLKEDHAQPSDEVNEVYNFLEKAVKEAKAA